MTRLSTPGLRLLTPSGILERRADDPDDDPTGGTPGAAPQRFVIYQRQDGDDRSADGTLARPFGTLAAALATWPLDAQGNTYVIDRTGCTDQLPAAFCLPALRDSRGPQLRFPAQPLAPFSTEGAFNIVAEPRTLATVAQIGDTAAHPRSQLVTVTVPGAAWSADQFRGRQIVAADGSAFAIHGNTTDSLRLCADRAPQLPWRIVEPSAVLVGDVDPAQARGTLNLNGAQATLMLGGQRIQSTSTWAGVLQSSGCLRVLLYACELEGDLQLSESASPIYFGACSLRPGVGQGWFLLERASALLFNSLVEGFRVQALTSGTSDLVLYQSIVEKSPAPLGLDLARLQLHRSEVLGATGAILPGGIAAGTLGTGPEPLGLAGADISLDEVRVDGCSGDGISIGLRSAAALRNVGGSNASLGLRVWNGGQVMVDVKTDVTGEGGDLKVGSRAVRAWSDFRAAGNEADFFDAEKSDGSRLFQA